MATRSQPETIADVKGWFPRIDQRLFTWFLEREAGGGDLLELGAYLGKSAILMGNYVHAGETFTVCDLFEDSADSAANQRENAKSYESLTRTAFEQNYLAFHERLPVVVQGLTSVILDHVGSSTCRFVHVDASHLYEHVRGDLEAARTILAPDGIIVCDDYRSGHTPGVAAAVWEAVVTGELRPICLTPQKFYGTWGDPEAPSKELITWLSGQDDCQHEVQEIAGHRVLRIWEPKGAKKPGAADAKLKELKLELRQEKDGHRRAQRDLSARMREVESIRRSASFRAGRVVTAPLRAIRKLRR